MNQLSLFPTHEPRPSGYGFFLAVFPDERAAQDIYELGAKLRRKHGLSGRMRPLNHLHISLPFDIEFDELDHLIQLVDVACKAIAGTTPMFEVTFDRVLSFKHQTSDRPLVLVGGKYGNAELKAFHRLLAAKLSNRGNATPKFTPHVTLLYDREIPQEPTSPVSWKVNEVVLVRSHVGDTKYDRIERWMLRD